MLLFHDIYEHTFRLYAEQLDPLCAEKQKNT